MSRVHTKESRILVNEFSISCDINRYGLTHNRALADVTTICEQDGARFTPGLLSGAVNLGGFVTDNSTGTLYAEAKDAVGVDNGFLVTALPAGYSTVGAPAFVAVSDLSEFALASSTTEAVTVSVAAVPDGGVDWGVLLHGLSAETADGDGTTVDGGAASTGGGVASLHVTAFSGLTNNIVKVQHSTDDVIWSDLITFTTVTGVTSERATVTGTVNRYVRATWDVTGTGTTTFAVAFARR